MFLKVHKTFNVDQSVPTLRLFPFQKIFLIKGSVLFSKKITKSI